MYFVKIKTSFETKCVSKKDNLPICKKFHVEFKIII